MANAIYPDYKEALLSGSTDTALTSGTVKVSLIDTGVAGGTYDPTDTMYSDIPAASVISTVTLASKTVTDGIFDADDIAFLSVPAGDPCEALLFWIDTGVTTTSRLVAWLDTGITGFPITPSGGNIDVTWNASGIFRL